jgi:hypothetical protein
MRALPVSACLLLVVRAVLEAQAVPTTSAPLQWGPAPAVFPAGAKMAVVSGDPSKRAPFTVELALPAGYKVPPHFHTTSERVEVKQGTLFVGMGDAIDTKNAQPLTVGPGTVIRSKLHHYAFTKAPATIAVTALGPFDMTYVNPADDPQKAGAKR